MPEKNKNILDNTGVINPYALAEVIAGRSIPWKNVDDKRKILESVLQTPYEELFDPKYDSPLYFGFRLNKNLELEQVRPAILDIEIDTSVNDKDRLPVTDIDQLQKIGDLGALFQTKDVAGIKIDRAEMLELGTLRLYLSQASESRIARLARAIPKDVIKSVVYLPKENIPKDYTWTPPTAYWGDYGRFFNEAAEFFDPIQGAVANCYLIAAMASVAWARPYNIMHQTRATGTNQQQFTNKIRFYHHQTHASTDIEVTDNILLRISNNQPMYARSSEAGETWPAIYEKAFAKWETGTNSDQPDITATAWGSPSRAVSELTGLTHFSHKSTDHTAKELWDIVRANSLSHRTFNPMVASTYSSGDATPDKVVYSDANLVASHAYSILGWDYRDNKRYIILRNPWGSTEATAGTTTGTVYMYDISWWRPITLADPDGVFALRDTVFKQYFYSLGGAS